MWYRSKIKEIDGNNVLVEFVEYGNQDYTTVEELKPKDALDEKLGLVSCTCQEELLAMEVEIVW